MNGVSKVSDTALRRMIANMLMIGFDEAELSADNIICRQIAEEGIGGVILFDRFYHDRERLKNIYNPRQLKQLTRQLQEAASGRLLIAVDQEGGRVQRLKSEYGFHHTPSAREIAASGETAATEAYDVLSKMLSECGINCNFAPDVDLALNDKNHVIVGLERSYGKSPDTVARFGGIFADALKAEGVVPVLKHFPGHGSSLEDSHKGFVDVSETWSEEELEPFRILIEAGKADMVMTAHVFNRNLDPKYPATLSHTVTTGLLRDKLGFDGVIISDDLQMEAIASQYSLEETVTLAINAGVDMLLFGNQLGSNDAVELIDLIEKQVRSGAVPYERIEEANRRIDELKGSM
ncbi:MAG: beta-N-acetylhexosaminidase [Sulfurimonadaceae bacterium]|nr:beta-N-acetylhexosaminidase [Sulfurimonadaceae bacterium]